MLAAVLTRFKNHLKNGYYDDPRHIKPLLSGSEQAYIKRQQDNEDIKELLTEYYGDNIIVMTEIGNLDFSPAGMADIVNGQKLFATLSSDDFRKTYFTLFL